MDPPTNATLSSLCTRTRTIEVTVSVGVTYSALVTDHPSFDPKSGGWQGATTETLLLLRHDFIPLFITSQATLHSWFSWWGWWWWSGREESFVSLRRTDMHSTGEGEEVRGRFTLRNISLVSGGADLGIDKFVFCLRKQFIYFSFPNPSRTHIKCYRVVC